MYSNNRAGKSVREMAQKRRSAALWIGIVGIATILIIALLLQNISALGIGGGGILFLLIALRVLPDIIEGRVDKKLKEEKRAIRGAKGEEKIGGLLSLLSPDFHILHDIESPYGNIDHIVISKDHGIFLIETKAHGGKVEVDGDKLLVNGKTPEKDFISQTLKNTHWLKEEINEITNSKPWITSILVFTNAFVPPSKPIKGVTIINKKYLLGFLQRSSRPNDINAKIWEKRVEIYEALDSD